MRARDSRFRNRFAHKAICRGYQVQPVPRWISTYSAWCTGLSLEGNWYRYRVLFVHYAGWGLDLDKNVREIEAE